jgi:hypothetical protein
MQKLAECLALIPPPFTVAMSRIIIEAMLICIYETILVASISSKKQSSGRVLSSYSLYKVCALKVLTSKMPADTCKPETALKQSGLQN